MTLPIDTTVPEEDAPQAELVDAPDRADAPVSEITERFLKVVIAHVPLDRIEELHLFSPLRQGGVETGIAVIAARVPVVVVESSAAPELPFEEVVDEEEPAPEDEAEIDAEGDAEVEAEGEVEADAENTHGDVEAALDVDVIAEHAADEELDEADVLADADDVAVIETTPVPRVRHTVYTARYRLVQKGPERGKWEADVVAEAEAPLITVDLVVRGVQRRAGEESEIVRYSAPQLARALRVPFPAV
ncbi:hypothetical protein [Gemmatimonas groenlandica]|uniref:Uncharacterized protein n=1 Tax=Gemmatimonas groenlandica TaxID=2732249 RepID=A0A6M4IMH7_9BACT|nr:hypothetical protein [Gemmatimonas groenlandica]QJR35860.1 hypothetical protein HKW67_10225 [Gemmatimonas groenlandica]